MTTIAARPPFSVDRPAPTAAEPPCIAPKMAFRFDPTAEMARLRACSAGEFFYFIESKGEVVGAQGVQKWLGFSEAQFTRSDFELTVHASHAAFFEVFSTVFWEQISARGAVETAAPRLVTSLAMKHRNGQRLLFKCTSSGWPTDRGLAVLREFELIGLHRGEPLGPRFSMAGPSEPDGVFFEKMSEAARKRLAKKLPFTSRQKELLALLATEMQLTERELGEKLFISAATVHVHARMILPLAAAFFDQKFLTLRALAEWLRASGGV